MLPWCVSLVLGSFTTSISYSALTGNSEGIVGKFAFKGECQRRPCLGLVLDYELPTSDARYFLRYLFYPVTRQLIYVRSNVIYASIYFRYSPVP